MYKKISESVYNHSGFFLELYWKNAKDEGNTPGFIHYSIVETVLFLFLLLL